MARSARQNHTIKCYVVGSKSFRPDQLIKVTEIEICCFSTYSPFISTHFSTDTLTSPYMALYIPHSIFHLARLLYVRQETFGPYYIHTISRSALYYFFHPHPSKKEQNSKFRTFKFQVSIKKYKKKAHKILSARRQAFPDSNLLLSTDVTVQAKPDEVQAITGVSTCHPPYKTHVFRPQFSAGYNARWDTTPILCLYDTQQRDDRPVTRNTTESDNTPRTVTHTPVTG